MQQRGGRAGHLRFCKLFVRGGRGAQSFVQTAVSAKVAGLRIADLKFQLLFSSNFY